jgi:L,D-peptidoglycan transpeptidase YkuD (ErfK/YbiS/YcfS/YnhG family)
MRHAITSVVVASLMLSGCANALGGRAPHAGAGALARAAHPQPGAARAAASAPARTSPPATKPAAGLLPGAGGRHNAAHQMVTVVAPSYGATYARLTVYHLVRGRWHRVLGPWTARIGRRGMAPPGQKREGDLRTPSGDFAFGFFFGAQPNPGGVAFTYRQAHSYDFWDDDPSSARYNEWVDERYGDPGTAPEPMDVSGYDYGVVIAYNTARTPGLGSAIFLHVNIGTATSGCVTLPMGELLRLLRWLRPAQSPRIVMGVAASAAAALPQE